MTSPKASFFKQSSWMVIATFAGGVFMTFVHRVAEPMGDEYAVFNTLLRMLVIISIPATALQTVFTQNAASAFEDTDHKRLAGTTQGVIKVMSGLWLAFAILLLLLIGPISSIFRIPNKAALVLTVLFAFTSMLTPVFKGLLQGKHRFTGLGSLVIMEGLGRFLLIYIAVSFLRGKAAGAVSSALLAQGTVLAVAAWMTRDIWRNADSSPFDWKPWLKQIFPLTIGIASVALMSSVDMLFVQALFPDAIQRKLYSGAMMTGFAIIQFIAPVTSVMYPRIVQSVARSEKTDTLALSIKVTVLFSGLAAIGGTLLPKLPLQVIYHDPLMWTAAPLVPWYAWAVIPNTAANVLVLNLLARSKFDHLHWLFAVPLAYICTLGLLSPLLSRMEDPFNAFRTIIFTMGSFNLLLACLAAWVTWRKAASLPATQREANSALPKEETTN